MNDASKRLQRVTQWMSWTTVACGSAANACQSSSSGVSTSPHTRKLQPARSGGYSATSPAWSTGHFSVRYWPGGRRAGSYPASTTFRSALLLNTLGTLVVDDALDGTDCSTASRLRRRERPRGSRPISTGWCRTTSTALAVGDSCEALLLTAKGRIIAPLVVLRRGEDDLLLLTEPGLGEAVRGRSSGCGSARSARSRPESHTLDGRARRDRRRCPLRDYGVPAIEIIDTDPPPNAQPIERRELERLRILARSPSLGPRARRAVCFRRRPVSTAMRSASPRAAIRARSRSRGMHHRGHPNRELRVHGARRWRPPCARHRAAPRRQARGPGHERRPRSRSRGCSPSATSVARSPTGQPWPSRTGGRSR